MESDGAFRFVTFNTGLARNFVAYAQERLESVAEALAVVPADVVCLQEVWEPDDFRWIQETASKSFPYSYYEFEGTPGAKSKPSCTLEDLKPLLECIQEHCMNTSDLSGCVLRHCTEAMSRLSPACRKCLAVNVSKSIAEVAKICVEGSAEFAYDGRNGLAILSRYPLNKMEKLELPAYFIRRGALMAEVATPKGPVKVLCTHLSTPLEAVPYMGKRGTWEEEQKAQIEALIEHTSKMSRGVPTVLAGDFNCGPKLDNTQGEFPEHFQLFLDAGWHAPYLDLTPPQCTFCSKNELVKEEGDKLLDHVLLMNFPRSRYGEEARRIFDIPVNTPTGIDVENLPLSDHYGVFVQKPAYP